MLFLVSLALALLFVLTCRKPLRKCPVPFYLGAAAISAAVLACSWANAAFPAWFRDSVWAVFSRAAFSTALFALVMIAGALPNGSRGIKLLMPVRGPLSILASILTLGHNAGYARTYFRLLFTNPGRLPANQLAAAICSVIMIVIMLPLLLTSFGKVRRKMDPRGWKRLQRLAYPFYGLIWLHVMLLTVPGALRGVSGCRLTIFAYSAVFLSYAVCRTQKALAARGQKSRLLFRRQCAGAVCGLAAAFVIVGSVSAAQGAGLPADTAGARSAAVRISDGKGASPAPESAAPATARPGAAPISDPPPAPEISAPAPSVDVPAAGTADTPPAPSASAPGAGPSAPPAAPGAAAETPAMPEAAPSPAAPQQTVPPEPEPTPIPEPSRRYRNGTFTGTGEGYWSTITAAVTIQDDVITGITITGGDDEPYFTDAKAIVNTVLAVQHTDLDAVSGATYSSYGILDAIDAAMASAEN